MILQAASAVVFVAAISPAWSAAAQTIEVNYTDLGPRSCDIVESGEPDGHDWLLHRCEGLGGIAVWLLYQDSARLQVAFGPRDFEDYNPWSYERDVDWPIEWRSVRGSRPYAAIIRLRRPFAADGGRADSELAVFRVWPDRPDCFLGTAPDNATARRLADQARQMTACPAR